MGGKFFSIGQRHPRCMSKPIHRSQFVGQAFHFEAGLVLDHLSVQLPITEAELAWLQPIFDEFWAETVAYNSE